MKNRLIVSAPSAEEMLKAIAEYFFGKPKDFVIHEKAYTNGTSEGDVYRMPAVEKLSGYVVKSKKGRYRFERIME